MVALEVLEAPRPGFVPEAAPVRFALLEDGTLFVGGSSEVVSGRIEKGEAKTIEKQIAKVRKLTGLGSQVRLGPGETRRRLTLSKGLAILCTGDPARAPAAFRLLAELLVTLEGFFPPSLTPFAAAQYLLIARKEPIVGGCRSWTFPGAPLAEASAGPRLVPAAAATGWPTGALAANVCSGEQTYTVALRPLLPGERP
jgi:hypothetical protein